MNPQSLFVRKYETDDYQMVHKWRQDHASIEIEPAALPPLGVVVCDGAGPMAALWCYEPAGIGCGFLELPVSRPGLTLSEATAAFQRAVTALMELAGKGWEPPGEYRAFRVCAPPPIARVLARMGFLRESASELIPMLFIKDSS